MKVDRSLWQRLESFTFDDEFPEHSFADRLARENGWSEAYTERVLNEYQRFLYLSQVADHPVTPSEAVDQAWHLHLIYTRSYWSVLCATVLDRPLHHGPSRGGPEEDERYREQYAATVRSYRLAFGDPPEDIWPDIETRFRRPDRMRFVDMSEAWIVPKRPPEGLLPYLGAVYSVVMAGALAVFVIVGPDRPSGIGAFAVLIAGVLVKILYDRRKRSSRRADGAGGDVSCSADGSSGDGGGGGCGS